jgi:hypothetical protein
MAQSFNWSVFHNLDKIADTQDRQKDKDLTQFHAGPQIKKLSWTGGHPEGTSLYWWYSLLCDYVHPNYGAKVLFVNTQEGQDYVHFQDGGVNRLYKMHLQRRPEHVSALKHIVGVIYLPLREALSRTTAHIEWLTAEQRRRYRDLRSLERLAGLDTSNYFRSGK